MTCSDAVQSLGMATGIAEAGLVALVALRLLQQRRLAWMGDNAAAHNIVLPIYMAVLVGMMAASCFQALVRLSTDISLDSTNSVVDSAALAWSWALFHTVYESLSFVLLQQGGGMDAALNAITAAMAWGTVVYLLKWAHLYQPQNYWLAGVALEAVLFVFYGAVIVLPQRVLFRRPAIRPLALYFTVQHFLTGLGILVSNGLGEDWGYCTYAGGASLLFVVALPYVSYRAMVMDSNYWQGIAAPSEGALDTPLLGMSLDPRVAAKVAAFPEYAGKVPLLHFARLKMEKANLLGAGGTARVYRGFYKSEPVAIKMLFVMDLNLEVIQTFIAEASTHASLEHPNVVTLRGVVVQPPSVCIVLELCANGSLFNLIHERAQPIEWDVRMGLALGCLEGLAHLHELNLLHNDIKSQNYLVDADWTAKIADFELSCLASLPETVPVPDTVNWIAPEVIKGEPVSVASDVYAFVMVVYELVTGLIPYERPLIRDAFFSTVSGQDSILDDIVSGAARPRLPEGVPPVVEAMLARGWAADPAERPSLAQLRDELHEAKAARPTSERVQSLCVEARDMMEVGVLSLN